MSTYKHEFFLRLQESKDHLINRNDKLSPEQKTQAIEFFKTHPTAEKNLDWNKSKDFEWKDFERVFSDSNKTKSAIKRVIKDDKKELFRHNSHCRILGENDKFIFVMPKDYQGCVFMDSYDCGGSGAKWCIGWKDDNSYYTNYFSAGFAFFLAFNKNPTNVDTDLKYMIQVQPDVLMNDPNVGAGNAWPQNDKVDDTLILKANSSGISPDYTVQGLTGLSTQDILKYSIDYWKYMSTHIPAQCADVWDGSDDNWTNHCYMLDEFPDPYYGSGYSKEEDPEDSDTPSLCHWDRIIHDGQYATKLSEMVNGMIEQYATHEPLEIAQERKDKEANDVYSAIVEALINRDGSVESAFKVDMTPWGNKDIPQATFNLDDKVIYAESLRNQDIEVNFENTKKLGFTIDTDRNSGQKVYIDHLTPNDNCYDILRNKFTPIGIAEYSGNFTVPTFDYHAEVKNAIVQEGTNSLTFIRSNIPTFTAHCSDTQRLYLILKDGTTIGNLDVSFKDSAACIEIRDSSSVENGAPLNWWAAAILPEAKCGGIIGTTHDLYLPVVNSDKILANAVNIVQLHFMDFATKKDFIPMQSEPVALPNGNTIRYRTLFAVKDGKIAVTRYGSAGRSGTHEFTMAEWSALTHTETGSNDDAARTVIESLNEIFKNEGVY
jgi:hypothetical protein